LNSQLDQIKKQTEIVLNDTTIPEEATKDHIVRKAKGIEFDYKPLNLRQRNIHIRYASEDHGMIKIEEHGKKSKLIGFVGTNVGSVNNIMLKHSQRHQNEKKTTRPWTCHYCKRKGNIRPFCYKLYGYPEHHGHKSHESGMRTAKKEWIPKVNNVGLMDHTSQESSSNEVWYFDSGCSRHMTGKIGYIENIRPCEKGFVTFGDGGKGKIRGIGNLIRNGLPNLENVFLVEGLRASLISITQLCDQGMEAIFDRFGCKITDEKGEVFMRGIRKKNNCYKWISDPKPETDMLNTMLKHHESLAMPQLKSKDKRSKVCENSSTWKNNQTRDQLHSIKNSDSRSVPTTDTLIDEFSKILNLEKYDKLRDSTDISLKEKL